MKLLLDIPEIKNAGDIFNKIFTPDSSFPESFTKNIESKGILFPLESILNYGIYKTLKKTAIKFNDSKCYAILFNQPQEQSGTISWLLDFENDTYFQINENLNAMDVAIFSTKGDWGIIHYDTGISLIGGGAEFVKVFYSNLSLNQNDNKYIQEFLHHYKNNVAPLIDNNYKGLYAFLSHLYSEDVSKFLIKKYIIE
jgi:hypothetical protein